MASKVLRTKFTKDKTHHQHFPSPQKTPSKPRKKDENEKIFNVCSHQTCIPVKRNCLFFSLTHLLCKSCLHRKIILALLTHPSIPVIHVEKNLKLWKLFKWIGRDSKESIPGIFYEWNTWKGRKWNETVEQWNFMLISVCLC